MKISHTEQKPISNNLLNISVVLPEWFAHASRLLGKGNPRAHLWSRWLRWTRSWCPPCGCPPLGCTCTGRLLQSGSDNLKTHSTRQRCPCHPTCPFWTHERHCRETGREGSPQVHPARKSEHWVEGKCPVIFPCPWRGALSGTSWVNLMCLFHLDMDISCTQMDCTALINDGCTVNRGPLFR